LAKALLHHPKLILLDEPANGLDPAGIVEIRDLLLNLAHEQGVTVFMSTHILGEVSRLADRIGIIHQGRLLQELSITELNRNRRRKLLIRTRSLPAAQAMLVEAGFLVGMRIGDILELDDGQAIQQPDDIATRLVEAGLPPTMLSVEEEDLEHYFLRLVGLEEADGG
jgi:ABC-2 type transport system ATP-binding protein